jgi:predicted Zn-dependent protease with MMP-like domain
MPLKRRGELARQYPERRVDVPEPEPATFEALVERALDELPDEFSQLLDDVAIVIADIPRPEQTRWSDTPEGAWLYGIYEGVPSTEWGADMVPFPNKITLFQVPLETDFPDPDELAEQVRITVIHELAHHAGIDDERLHELNLD